MLLSASTLLCGKGSVLWVCCSARIALHFLWAGRPNYEAKRPPQTGRPFVNLNDVLAYECLQLTH